MLIEEIIVSLCDLCHLCDLYHLREKMSVMIVESSTIRVEDEIVKVPNE